MSTLCVVEGVCSIELEWRVCSALWSYCMPTLCVVEGAVGGKTACQPYEKVVEGVFSIAWEWGVSSTLKQHANPVRG